MRYYYFWWLHFRFEIVGEITGFSNISSDYVMTVLN
jgi:hypothetical protein